MAKSSAAKTKNQQLTEVEQWFATAPAQSTIHAACGHDVKAHVSYTSANDGVEKRIIECPALPPAKARGTDFERELAAASEVDTTAERKKLALVNKQGRTWGELAADIEKEHRPQLHLAQDNGGKLRELYVGDKLLEAIATHLKLRWAKNVVEEAQERAPTPEKKAKEEAERAEKALMGRVRAQVADSVLDRVAAKYAADFAPLPQLRFLASRLGERALERFRVATGVKKFPKDWLDKGATPAELLALIWLDDAADEMNNGWEFDDRLLALAKSHGIDVKAAFEAQLATAKAEAEKGKES